MIEQKAGLLAQYQKELINAKERAQKTTQTIFQCEQEIESLKNQIDNNPKLKATEQLRDAYLEIKSKIQGENA